MKVKLYPKIDYLSHLNQQQYKIVTEAEGPCLVLAGAGSGKTRILVYRLCYLLEKGIPSSSILLVAFTNKSAKEMVTRVEKIVGFYPKDLWAGTFHHIGNSILKRYGKLLNLPSNFTILDEEDSIHIMKEIGKKIGEPEDFPTFTKIKEIISFSINTMTSIKDIVNMNFPQYSKFIPYIETILNAYQKKKKSINCVDYDDLLLLWYKLMKNENVCKEISSHFKYIMVDEYHDTNKLQSLILYQMAKVHRNILVVGDDAQSIYSFRGATINNILEFSKIYPDAKVFYLTLNYRSTPEILSLANNIISHNRVQFPKKLISIKNSGVKPLIVKSNTAKDEASFVGQRILQLLNSDISPSEIGVLFRSRYQSAELEIELNRLRIPYIIRGGLRFFEQSHIKDIVSYFRIIENFKDEISWRRILSLYEGIGEKSTETLLKLISESSNIQQLEGKIQNLKIFSKGKESLKILFETIKKISQLDFSSGIDYIMKSGYKKYLEKYYKDETERIKDITFLKEISLNYENISDFLSEITLQEHFKGENIENSSPVILSTIHQAKGLEWKIVFIIGVCANHFPHSSSTSDFMKLEEERRVFYVAVTRAEEDLYITYYLTDFYNLSPSEKSIFIKEMDETLFEKWDYR